jgi:ABC-type microcin C transport system duplicated ATPase subunit YejF
MSMLQVENLHIRFRTEDGVTDAVRHISFSLEEGETMALVGESGIATRDDAVYLQDNLIDAMLVGESLMRSQNIASAVRNLLGKK